MRGQSGMPGNEYADGMIEHDGNVGKLLKAVDDLGIANNTIVVYTTDNGPNQFSWPDAATTPFRSEKDTNWEGAFRVPAMVRWPGQIKPGQVSNEMFSGLDWFPTLLAAAGDTDDQGAAAQGLASVGGKTFKVHLDGYNQLPYLTGQQPKGRAQRVRLLQRRRRAGRVPARATGSSCSARGAAGRLRRLVRAVHLPAHPEALQPAHGPVRAGRHRLRPVRRLADQERLPDGLDDLARRAFLETFVEYPPSQPPASFTIDQVEADVEAKIKAKAEAMGSPPGPANPTGN